MKTNFVIVIAVALGISSLALADPLPDELIEDLNRDVSEVFWDKAVLSGGRPVERPPGLDPEISIIPRGDSRRFIEGAMPVGVAMWCGVEWRPYFLRIMQSERARSRWSEIQIAYIGMLFGAAQQRFADMLAHGADACPAQRKAAVEAVMANPIP